MGKIISARDLNIKHFTRRPYPIDPAFFGQNFIPLSLSSVSRRSPNRMNNDVFVRNGPLVEDMRKPMTVMAKERFNSNLNFGYSMTEIDRLVRDIKKNADDGKLTVLDFHYPVQDWKFMRRLDRELVKIDLRKHTIILTHLHVGPSCHKIIGDEIEVNGSARKTQIGRVFQALTNSFKISDRIIGVSEDTINAYSRLNFCLKGDRIQIADLMRDKSTVILNGIDRLLYSPHTKKDKLFWREDLGLNPQIPVLACYVGRLEDVKGIKTFIKILKEFNGWYGGWRDDWSFLIATSDILDPMRKKDYIIELLKLKRLIRESRLKICVDVSKYTRSDPRFVDTTKDILTKFSAEEFQELAEHDIFGGFLDTPVQAVVDILIHPAISEALGLAVVEANFASTFVIARDVGGIPEVIPHEEQGSIEWNKKGPILRKRRRKVGSSPYGVLIEQPTKEENPEEDSEAFLSVMKRINYGNTDKTGPSCPIQIQTKFAEEKMFTDYLSMIFECENEVRR